MSLSQSEAVATEESVTVRGLENRFEGNIREITVSGSAIWDADNLANDAAVGATLAGRNVDQLGAIFMDDYEVAVLHAFRLDFFNPSVRVPGGEGDQIPSDFNGMRIELNVQGEDNSVVATTTLADNFQADPDGDGTDEGVVNSSAQEFQGHTMYLAEFDYYPGFRDTGTGVGAGAYSNGPDLPVFINYTQEFGGGPVYRPDDYLPHVGTQVDLLEWDAPDFQYRFGMTLWYEMYEFEDRLEELKRSEASGN